jgi:hypothetical protein
MGQKVNPIGLRLGINRTWDSRWYADKGDYGELLHEDLKIREFLMKRTASRAGVEDRYRASAQESAGHDHTRRVRAWSSARRARISRSCAEAVEDDEFGEVHLNIVEVRKPEIDATLVANIAQQLERRVAFRRAMKRAVQSAMRWRPGHPDQLRRPSRRRGNRAHRMVPRRPRAAAHAARRCRLRHRDGEDRLRHLRRQGLDLQGRDHGARSDGVRTPCDRSPRLTRRTPGFGRRAQKI